MNSLPESNCINHIKSLEEPAVNEVDRKYNERKLFYENLLLKQKLSKCGINYDVYGDTISSFNNTTYRGDKTNEISKITGKVG